MEILPLGRGIPIHLGWGGTIAMIAAVIMLAGLRWWWINR
jgi:hypothetical protein